MSRTQKPGSATEPEGRSHLPSPDSRETDIVEAERLLNRSWRDSVDDLLHGKGMLLAAITEITTLRQRVKELEGALQAQEAADEAMRAGYDEFQRREDHAKALRTRALGAKP